MVFELGSLLQAQLAEGLQALANLHNSSFFNKHPSILIIQVHQWPLLSDFLHRELFAGCLQSLVELMGLLVDLDEASLHEELLVGLFLQSFDHFQALLLHINVSLLLIKDSPNSSIAS